MVWFCRQLALILFAASRVNAANNLNHRKVFDRCNETDIENSLWPNEAGYAGTAQLICDDFPQKANMTALERMINRTCILRCSSGYRISSSLEEFKTFNKHHEYAIYSCRQATDQLIGHYYWRYNDGSDPWYLSNFDGCVVTNCHSPVKLPSKEAPSWAPNQKRAWGWYWHWHSRLPWHVVYLG